jgi:hypothetical protein
MKNYTSLGTSPPTDYTRFNDSVRVLGGNGSGGRGGTGSGGSGSGSGSGISMRIENNGSRETREIIQNSGKQIGTHNLYSTENIIDINSNNPVHSSLSEAVNSQTIVLPFYRCIIDIVILNDLHVDIVDNINTETKNKVLCSGKIRKYRFNGAIQNYDLFVEMMNENVFHVKRRGIMMRVNVSDDLRKLIINTMVNYVGEGGDIIKETSVGGGMGGMGGLVDGEYATGTKNKNKNKNKKTSWFKCFGF